VENANVKTNTHNSKNAKETPGGREVTAERNAIEFQLSRKRSKRREHGALKLEEKKSFKLN